MPVEGERFSFNYIARGEPTSDSGRARLRVARLFTAGGMESYISRDAVELKLGVAVDRFYTGATDWSKFIQTAKLRDFLDFITVIAKLLRTQRLHSESIWLDGVAEIFREENVGYRVDRLGGVHFFIDAEFARNHSSSISALQGSRYAAARHHIELGQDALDQTPPQTREAIRHTYEAVETIFKLLYPQESRLGPGELTKRLRIEIEALPVGTERNALSKIAEAFKEWVISAQPYRHGQAVEEPDNPSITTAVLSVSMGLSFARWLAEIDGKPT